MDSKCVICNKELKPRFLTLTDGKCCKECWISAGIEDVPYIHADSRIYSSYDLPKFSEFRIQQETLKNNFHPTKTIYYNTGGIEFDDKSLTFRITRFGLSRKKFCIFRYDQYRRCTIEQDISKHTSVDLGRAALGETLLGERGWWSGALSNITTSASCHSLGVIIELQDCPMDSLYIPLIDSNTSGKNRKYAAAEATAEAIKEQLNRCRKRVWEEDEAKREAKRSQWAQERQEREAKRKAQNEQWEREMELRRKEYDEEIARIEREEQENNRKIEEYFKHKAREKQQKDKELQNQKMIVSTADEILKFKQLLDAGIITEEEFRAAKKQLLGL